MLSACASREKTPPVESAAEAVEQARAEASENTSPAITTTPPTQAATQVATDGTSRPEMTDRAQLFTGTGNFLKTSPLPAPAAAEGETYVLNYEGAEIREVIWNILGIILKENYTVHPAVQGTVALHTAKAIPRSALLPTLETLLRQYGFALVREGEMLKVMPAAFAIRGSVTPQLGSLSTPLPKGLSVQVVPLKWISAREMWKLLEPIVTDPTVMRIDDARNLLVLAGTENELRHLLEAIDLFDVDYMAGMSMGLFPLRGADARAVAQELSLLFGDLEKGPLAGIVRLITVDRLNGLLVVSTQPSYLEQARVWIERLEKADTAESGSRLRVYPVQNSKAENLAKLLNEIFGNAAARPTGAAPTAASRPGTPATTPRPATPAAGGTRSATGLSQPVQVIADKDNNALVILAAPEDYDVIEAAIKQLDVVQRQVLVEVMFAEVKLTGDLEFGVEWYLSANPGRSGIIGSLATKTGADARSTTITPPAPANVRASRGLTLVRTLTSGTQVGAILDLLESDSRASLVAAPSTVVADNQQATIKVGTRVPTLTATQTVTGGNNVIESVQYVETGVLLDVTPRIASGSRVALDLNVEVSDATRSAASTINSPDINNRSAKSSVTVLSGETVVMAGLIRQNDETSSAGLPVLAKIPILGGLFGRQQRSKDRTELLVLITPRVINDSREASEFTEDVKRKMPKLQEALSNALQREPLELKRADKASLPAAVGDTSQTR